LVGLGVDWAVADSRESKTTFEGARIVKEVIVFEAVEAQAESCPSEAVGRTSEVEGRTSETVRRSTETVRRATKTVRRTTETVRSSTKTVGGTSQRRRNSGAVGLAGLFAADDLALLSGLTEGGGEIDSTRKLDVLVLVVVVDEEDFGLGGRDGNLEDFLLKGAWFLAKEVHEGLLLRGRSQDGLGPQGWVRGAHEDEVIVNSLGGHGRGWSHFDLVLGGLVEVDVSADDGLLASTIGGANFTLAALGLDGALEAGGGRGPVSTLREGQGGGEEGWEYQELHDVRFGSGRTED